jgi:LysM repeat protein
MATQYGAKATSSVASLRDVRPLRSTHHVAPGETLTSIAGMYGIEPQTLIQMNSHAVGAGGIVHPGMRLQV